jgi:hypothetical protein
METISSSNTAAQTTEIYIKKILPGNIESVRFQLVGAIESLGYDIIEDEPHIVGRRGAKGWGTWYGSADVLDYAMILTVRLKPTGANSTRATFDYTIKHPMLNHGEKNIVVQEAHTIAAICRQSVEKICSACETESTDDSKFCRKCGAPLTTELAELEVLRMMAEIRAGKTSVVTAAIMMPLAVICFTLAFILKIFSPIDIAGLIGLFALGGIAAMCAIMCVGFGWNRINRTLKKTETPHQPLPRRDSTAFQTGEINELPPRQPAASITEGTTNLLDWEWSNQREKEKVPLVERRDTNDLN